MSLVRIALRIAGVQALRGNTDVGANVLDSQIGAIDIGADNRIRTDQKKPFLALYTDTAKSGANAGSGDAFDLGARVLTLNGVTDIVIEAGVTAAMTTIDPDTDTEILSGIGVPAIDRNLEAQLDIIIRQVCTALNDPDNEWADIFRGLTHRYVRIERLRAATPEGQRIAAHQLRITASLIDDPLPGEGLDPEGVFARFLSKAASVEADPDLAAIVAKFATLIGGTDADWEALQRSHGFTRAELLALGRGPLPDDDERATPEFETGRIETSGYSPTAEVEG
jgi:hypothetical protein